MEKKFTFSDKPLTTKIVYASVITILCVSAIIVGIVAANNRKKADVPVPDNPPIGDSGDTGNEGGDGGNNGGTNEGEGNKDNENLTLTFTSPTVGTVMKSHSTTVPVYSDTLGEWRVHLGIDIEAEEGSDVFASSSGKVIEVYSDNMLGNTVKIQHSDELVTVYSNLGDDISVAVGDTVSSGEKIGTVGDSSLSELADESHIHFELLANGVSVNPLDYISEESKEASLGIVAKEEN